MSYWNDHPEDWDQVCCDGIANRLIAEIDFFYLGNMEREQSIRVAIEDTLLSLIEYPEFAGVYASLRDWAHENIKGAEARYWADMANEQ